MMNWTHYCLPCLPILSRGVLVLMNATVLASDCPPACGPAAAGRNPSGGAVLEKLTSLGLKDRDEITHRHECRELLTLRVRESSCFGLAGKLLDSHLDRFGCSELRELFGHLRRKTRAHRLEEFVQDTLGCVHSSIIAKLGSPSFSISGLPSSGSIPPWLTPRRRRAKSLRAIELNPNCAKSPPVVFNVPGGARSIRRGDFRG